MQLVLIYTLHFVAVTVWLILLFQLSLEFERLTKFDIHSRFDEKLSIYASDIQNVKCTVQKGKFAEDKKKNPVVSTFSQSYISNFKIFYPI